jgi:hypothetical protein
MASFDPFFEWCAGGHKTKGHKSAVEHFFLNWQASSHASSICAFLDQRCFENLMQE